MTTFYTRRRLHTLRTRIEDGRWRRWSAQDDSPKMRWDNVTLHATDVQVIPMSVSIEAMLAEQVAGLRRWRH